MVDMPKTVRIGYIDWSIVVDSVARGNRNFGETDYVNNTIHLDDNNTHPRMQLSLLHELIHAASGEYLDPEDGLSERQVKMLTQALMMILSQPQLSDFLLSVYDSSA